MGSIPLPALSVRPPQDPSDIVSKALQLRSMAGQQKLQQQQLANEQLANQSGQVGLQQQQMALKSQQAMMKAYTEAGGDLDKAGPLAAKYGADPGALIKLKEASIQQQKQALELLKTRGERAIQESDLMQGAHEAVAKALPEQRAQVYQQQLQSLQQSGVDVSQVPPQYPGDEAFALLGAGVKGHAKALDDAVKEQQLATPKAAQAASEANTAKTKAETGTGELAYRSTLQKIANKQPVSPEEMNNARAYEASQRKFTSSSDAFGLKSTNVSGPSGLSGAGQGGASGSSAGMTSAGQKLVDEIGTGKMAISRLDMILSRNPTILQAVAEKYSRFDSSKVKSYTDAYRSFTSGPDSKQLNAGAVAMQHLAQLKDINDKNPTTVRIPGTAANKAYQNLLDTVADELVTFYGEPKTNEAIGSKKSTLGGLLNRDAAITEQASAMGVKFDELEQKWANAAPSKAYQAPMPNVSDAAKRARAKLDPEYAQRLNGEGGGQPARGGTSRKVFNPSTGQIEER